MMAPALRLLNFADEGRSWRRNYLTYEMDFERNRQISHRVGKIVASDFSLPNEADNGDCSMRARLGKFFRKWETVRGFCPPRYFYDSP
jgi:hypothetical protein